MFYKALTFRKNLHAWLKLVNRAPKSINWCTDAVCDASVAPTYMPSIELSTASPITPSVVPSVVPTENRNICEHKSKRVCKN